MVNTFMELTKNKLSQNKCHNIHIGKQVNKCKELKVHNDIMKESKQEKYLGDIIHSSGKIKQTIFNRVAKRYGIISDIMSILDELPFGHRRIKTGLIL